MRIAFEKVCKDVTKTATKIPQSQYLKEGSYAIFDQGKDYIGGFSNSNLGVSMQYPYIVFGDHTRVLKYIEQPCFIGADGVKLLQVYNSEFLPKYVYYALLASPVESLGYSRHYRLLKEKSIKICDLDKQREIIIDLDKLNQAINIKHSQLNHLDDLVKSRFILQEAV